MLYLLLVSPFVSLLLHIAENPAIPSGNPVQDRTNLAFAALQLNRDLHFSEYVYGMVSTLTVRFIAFSAPPTPNLAATHVLVFEIPQTPVGQWQLLYSRA